ncbi:MAG: hypothetical protein M5R40_01115 [Anaerolineae bacterium]|nr:hypothetical protein [Anaerolineae bacterium]
MGFPIDAAPVVSLALSPGFADDGVLFAGAEACGLFRSDDRGRTWARLAADALTGAVNAVLLAPGFPGAADMLVIHEGALRLSRDGGQTWAEGAGGAPLPAEVTAVAAPHGLDAGAPLLVGLADGTVRRLAAL